MEPAGLRLNNESRGFTLVETLVALTILSVAMTPVLILASSSLRIATSIKNNIIAANLAQEGIESVRAIRDGNWFQGKPFDTDLSGCSAGCRIDWNSNSASQQNPQSTLPLAANPALLVSPGNGVYHNPETVIVGSTPSIFSRKITIQPRSSGEMIVTSEVSWKERNSNRSILVEDHLFDWK